MFIVQLLSRVWLLATPWTTAHQAPLSSTVSQSLLRFMSIESVMPSNSLTLCRPPPSPPALSPSQHQGLFQWVDFLHQVAKVFSISPSNEYSGLISFRIGWLYLLAFQGTLKSSLAPQFKSISSSAFSLLCGPTLTSVHDYWKNHSLDYINLFQQSDVSAF